MKQPTSLPKRVQRFIAKRARNTHKGWDYSDAPDVRRHSSQLEHPMDKIVWALEMGLLTNQPTLRDVEQLLEDLGPWARALTQPISDTTLDTEARRLDPSYLLDKLVLRVRDLQRSKMLAPVGLPCSVVTVDGKNLATLDHDAAGTGHARSSANDKWHRNKTDEAKRGTDYYLMPALRATLSSAEAKPCIYQLPLNPGVGESTMFSDMIDALDHAYGRSGMLEVIDADAGLTSLANADRVHRNGYHYIFGLKGNQPELYCEAQALLDPLAAQHAPEAQTLWERRNGKRIRRSLWRTGEMAGIENSVGTWTHLRQTWLVRQETWHANGNVDVEDRYFISSLPWDTFTPQQILLAIRNHWAVENDTFNTLDLQWREDAAPWCTQGTAVWALGVLRLMAYNTAQLLRRRRLRTKQPSGRRDAPMRWRSLFKIIEHAFKIELHPASVA